MSALYWRIYIEEGVSDSEGPYYIYRLHMAEERYGPSVALNGVAIASGGEADRAFNATTAVWLSGSGSPQWIGYEFPHPVDLVEIRIESRGASAYVLGYPGRFKIQSSDDGEIWTDRGEFNDVMFRNNETFTFMVDANRDCRIPYNIIHSNIHILNTGASVQLGMNSYEGDGSIAGQIRINGAPAPGFVSLFDSERGILVGKDETNSIGEYKFENLNRAILYDVIAQDQNREWEKRVSSRRVPYASVTFNVQSYNGESMQAELEALVPNVDHFDTDSVHLYTQLGSVNSAIISDGSLKFSGAQGVLARAGEVFSDGEVGVVISSAQDAGFAFRIQDASNYYLAAIYDANGGAPNRVYLYKRIGGSFVTIVGNIPIIFPRGTPTKFHANLSGDRIRLYINDAEIADVNDTTYVSGLAGPRSNGSPSIFESYFWP